LLEPQGIHPFDTNDKKHYSITIMENENLQKLFPVKNGKSVRWAQTLSPYPETIPLHTEFPNSSL
jgi:hypothetical protein